MMRKLFLLFPVLAAVAMAVPGQVLGQNDPRAGNWKLSVAKSKYDPGPPPSGETRTYEIHGRAMKVTIESTDAQGHKVNLSYTANDDGKDYPVSGLAMADAITVKRVDAQTFDMETKKGGKVIGTSRAQISHGGKTLTLTSNTAGVDGKPIHNVAVYDKQ